MAFTERYVTSGAGGGGDGSSGTPWTLAEALTSAASGDRVNVQSDAGYSLGADAFTNAGTVGAPIVLRGYNSSIGDLDGQGFTSTGFLDTTDFPVITLTGVLTMNQHCVLQNLDITGALSSQLVGDTTVDLWHAISCRIINTQNNASARVFQGDNDHEFTNCEFSCTGAAHSSLIQIDTYASFSGCRFKSTDSDALVSLQNGNFDHCTFWGNSSSDAIAYDQGVQTTRHYEIRNCTFQGIGDAITTVNTAPTFILVVSNCHVTDCSSLVNNANANSLVVIESFCRTRNLTSKYTNVEPITIGNVTAAGDSTEFADAANGDFHLDSGEAGRDAGAFGQDIGAWQHVDAAGGGGILVHPGMTGGVRG